MLDTKARKYVDPFIEIFAKGFLKLKMTPNQVTILAFFIGVSSGLFVYLGLEILAVIILWISGLFDAVDGAMARKINKTSSWGTLMDITFDRLVEISIIISISLKYPDSRIYLVTLCSAIIFSMTVFLTVGALSNQKGMKSFYYQAGLAERTEGFILFSLMILLNKHLIIITNIFSLVVFITAVQRMLEARKHFNT